MSAEPAYTYDAWLLPSTHDPAGVVDGDTMHVGVNLGMDVSINTILRIYGVNAPELKTVEGKAAKQWAVDWFQTHCPQGKFVIQTVKDKQEKYGRYLATIIAPDGANFNTDIVAASQAVPYFPKLADQ